MNSTNNTRNLSVSEMKALKYIILNGPTYSYELSHNKLKIFGTEKTANITLNKLARQNLLQKTENKQARSRKYYDLTLKGLCAALALFPATDVIWADLERTSEKWGKILPFLNKFNIFKKYDLQDFFKRNLQHVARKFVFFHGFYWVSGKPKKIELEFIAQLLHQCDEAEFMNKWNHILRDDSELMAITIEVLEVEKGRMEKELEKYGKRLNEIIPELKKSNPDWDRINSIESDLVGNRGRNPLANLE
jgi:DNA-binding PadR family transcriptional regulator